MLFSVASARLLMASLWSLFSKCLQYFDLWRILLQTEIIYNIFPDSAIALDSLFPVRQSPVCRITRFLFGSALQSSPTAWCVSGRNHHFSQPHRLAELLPGEAFVFVKGMAVDVQGGAGLRVAQQARHRAHIHTLGDEHTGICVPQAVHVQVVRQAVLPQDHLEPVGKSAWNHWVPIGLLEQVVILRQFCISLLLDYSGRSAHALKRVQRTGIAVQQSSAAVQPRPLGMG